MPSNSQPALPDFTGKVLANGLELLEVLGSGSWGTVYKARDCSSHPDDPDYYAVKVLRIANKFSPEEDMQSRELRHHSTVSGHPNIVVFHRVIYDFDFVYIILDLCAGGDLFTQIVRNDFFVKDSARIKFVFMQILDAVDHCHKRGVFHRDLKPENILCSKDGMQVYVADFGLATSSPWSLDHRCGSWEYMSPDCIGKDFTFKDKMYASRQNDLWALGVILVNMITKRAPWKSARPADPCFAAFLKDKDYFLRVLPISEEVNQLLIRIFSLDARKRIPLPELRREILAIRSFFPPGVDEVKGDIKPLRADETSPRNSACISRAPTSPSAAPRLSFNLGGMLKIGHSFIDRITAQARRIAPLLPSHRPTPSVYCLDALDDHRHTVVVDITSSQTGGSDRAVPFLHQRSTVSETSSVSRSRARRGIWFDFDSFPMPSLPALSSRSSSLSVESGHGSAPITPESHPTYVPDDIEAVSILNDDEDTSRAPAVLKMAKDSPREVVRFQSDLESVFVPDTHSNAMPRKRKVGGWMMDSKILRRLVRTTKDGNPVTI